MDNNTNNNNSTIAIRVVCAIVFCIFTFCYTYFYQADILYVEQHVLSGGLTHYDRTIGSVLIVAVLYMLHLAIYSLVRLYKRMYAITYFPSLLLLVVITDYHPDTHGVFSFGVWPWLAILFLVIFFLCVYIARQLQPYEPIENSTGIFSKMMWINLLILTIMFFGVGFVGNGNDIMRYRMKMEARMMEGNYEEALKVGEKAMSADSSLTMLRIYALVRSGRLGDSLFCYPIVGGSNAMLPNGHSVRCFMYPEKNIIRFSRTRGARDYRLCRHLLDRNLDAFAIDFMRELDSIPSDFPKYYREALILYTRTRSNPSVVYHDEVMDADYEDLQELEKQYDNPVVRESYVRDLYGKTYWYYYFYKTSRE